MSKVRTIKVKALKNEPFHIESYESAYQVVQDCKTRKITDSMFDNMQRPGEVSKRWHGVESYKEALDFMENGYQPAVKKIKSGIKANLGGQGKRISFHNDVVGFAPIVPLAIMGVPQSMVNTHMKTVKAKVIDVYYDLTACAGTSTEQFIEAGSTLLSAILELEMQGYRMNIYATQTYTRPGEGADMLCIKVKSATQPLDLKRISFPLTHPAFFRVIGFDWYSKFPGAKYRCGYGVAMAHNYKSQQIRDAYKEMFGQNAVAFTATEIIGKGKDYMKEVMESNGKEQKRK